MIVRIRLRLGPKRRTGSARSDGSPVNKYSLALATAALLSPAALVAFVLALWSLAADLGWSGAFGIREGWFSRWQAWLLISILLQAIALILNRYGDRQSVEE